jgi:hypothetical protein
MKQVKVMTRSAGAVEHPLDVVLGKERTKKLDNRGIMFAEPAEEQIVSFGKTLVQVTSHVLLSIHMA